MACRARVWDLQVSERAVARGLQTSPPTPPVATLGGKLSRSQPCHRCVTHSRNQEDTGGHARTRSQSKLSTGEHWRNGRDTEGHEVRRVRDREAPGSNPGAPDQKSYSNRVLRLLRLTRGGHREV